MNRIYQGRVSQVEISGILSASNGERIKVRCRIHSLNFQLSTLNFLGPHHDLFQDAVNPSPS